MRKLKSPMFTSTQTGDFKMFVDDRTEIGTLECRLSSNRYEMWLNRPLGYGSVLHLLNLLLSVREEVEFFGYSEFRNTHNPKGIN